MKICRLKQFLQRQRRVAVNMSFLGKDYKFDREENFDGFLKSIGVPEASIQKHLNFKPTTKLIKEGDNYKSITITDGVTKETVFQSGVPFQEEIEGGEKVTTTYTVDGNVVTQELKGGRGVATFKREYSDNELKVTITADSWDGVAYRYYKP